MSVVKLLFLSLSILVSIGVKADEKMTLQTFLNRVNEQNLDLKVGLAKSDAADANASGLAIPPPMVGINQMKENAGNTAQGFELNQTIPFPTKLTNDYSARVNEAKSQEEMRKAQQNEITAKAKLLYLSLWKSQESRELLLDKKRVLEQHIKLSRSSARSDSFAGIHVLKAESDLDFLENEILASEQNIRERQVEIANFINADPNKLKIIAEEPPLSPIPNLSATPTTHQINALKFNLENLRNRESAAKSEWFPDLNIRYKEMGATSMSTRYNEVMFGITLPFVFFWEPNAASKKASAERLQGELELEKQKRSIDSERVTLMSKAELLKKQIENLKEKLIPKAERRMKLVHNLAPRDMETLQDHRETMEAFLELKLKALELRLEYEAVISSLEKYAASKGSSHD